jgi:hypothetical protein
MWGRGGLGVGGEGGERAGGIVNTNLTYQLVTVGGGEEG